MNNNSVPKVIARRSKRLGRGYGSGKGGHTSSRGQKGQKARGSVGVLFEGLKVKKSLLRRIPMLRGKTKNKPYPKAIAINLNVLNNLPEGTEVTLAKLVEAKVISISQSKDYGVKVLGDGTLTKKLTVSLPVSKSAREKIEKAGGSVTTK